MVKELIEPIIRIIVELYRALGSNPFASIFVASFIGNSIPYASVPYYLLLVIYSGVVRDPIGLVTIAIASGAGASLGKLVIYMIGRGASKIVPEKDRENIELFGRLIGRWGFPFLLVVASTPLPDDVILIPIAFAGYSVAQYFAAVFMGKIFVSLAIVFFGSGVVVFFEGAGIPQYIQIPILIIISISFLIIIMKIKWSRVIKEYEARGLQGALSEIYRNVVYIIRRA